MNYIQEKLEAVYGCRDSIALGLISNPGIGKTESVYQFAEKKGVKVVEVIASQCSPMEISGIKMPVNDTKALEVYDNQALVDMQDGDILFLDEFLHAPASVMNAMLTLVTQRQLVSGRKLADVMIVCAGNLEGSSLMTPQIKQRFLWHEVTFHTEQWLNYINNKYGTALNSGSKIVSAITLENYEQHYWNYLSPRTAEQIIKLLVNGATPSNKIFKSFGTSSSFNRMDIKQLWATLQESKTTFTKDDVTLIMVELGSSANAWLKTKSNKGDSNIIDILKAIEINEDIEVKEG
jgi:MoxR-like ATPase